GRGRETGVTSRFDIDTALARIDDTTFEGGISRAWWVFRGPNGGSPGAVLLPALVAAPAHRERAPTPLPVHYVEPPGGGAARTSEDGSALWSRDRSTPSLRPP